MVFLDLVMPIMDGLATAARMRALEADTNKPATPIIGTAIVHAL